jgi:hypothetical protein
MKQMGSSMIRLGFFLAISSILLVLVLSANAARQSTGNTEPIEVSMVALIANPSAYNNKFVRTRGFLCLEFEGNALYLHEEDYRYGMRKNAVQLFLSKSQREQFKKLSLKHVLIEGTAGANELQIQQGMYSGSIGNIKRLEAWGPRPDIILQPQEPSSSCSR